MDTDPRSSVIDTLRRWTGWQWNEGSRRWSAGATVALGYGVIYLVGVLAGDLPDTRRRSPRPRSWC